MNRSGKFWGSTSPIFNKNNVEINRIEGRKGGYCSEHIHKFKYNMFLVETGSLKITTWKDDDSGKPDEIILRAGETTIIPPGLFHKFEVIYDCVCFEIYWTILSAEDIMAQDIVRRTTGGITTDYNKGKNK